MTVREITPEIATQILLPTFGKVAKSNGEQLWMHSFTVWKIFQILCEVKAFPQLNAELRATTELACLLHDLKKATAWNQAVLLGNRDAKWMFNAFREYWQDKPHPPTDAEGKRSESLFRRGKTDHQMETEADFQTFLLPFLQQLTEQDLLPFELTEERARAIFDIAKHHFLEDKDISDATQPAFGNELKMLKWCDRLASMERIDVELIREVRRVNSLGRKLFDLTYVTISRSFGPSGALMLNAVLPAYLNVGWRIVVHVEGGVLLACAGEGSLPAKSELVDRVNDSYLSESFGAQKPQYGTKTTLTGLASDHPLRYIDAHRATITNDLDREGGDQRFCKLLAEILNLAGHNTPELPFVQVLYGLTCGVRGIPTAGRRWQEQTQEPLPLNDERKVSKADAIPHVFQRLRVEHVAPADLIPTNIDPSARLASLNTVDLLELLSSIATSSDQPTERDDELKRLFGELIAVEEDVDFAGVAQARFDAYKEYKQNPQSSTGGVCDICGATVTQKPGADFARGEIQAFFQTKARPDVSRKVCPLCAYDNSVLRAGVGRWIPIYLRASSRVPITYRQSFRELARSLQDGLLRSDTLENLRSQFGVNYPDIDVFLSVPKNDLEVVASSFDDLDVLVKLTAVDPKSFSSKDQAAKYEPLFHLLSLLGFRVNIGTEHQVGLFGSSPRPAVENYNWSLAAVILSRAIQSKRSFLGAQQLLNNAPSIAVRLTGEQTRRAGRSYMRLHPNLMPTFFRLLAEANPQLSANGGPYAMKDLFKNAALFADGIPIFCFSSDDWKKWRSDRSKHMVTKPVSQALNAMLLESDFEVAFSRFLDDIRSNIAKDKERSKKPENEQPKTDEKELAEFVSAARDALQRFHVMKDRDLGEFIRAKNALLSTIWVFARYPQVKEGIL